MKEKTIREERRRRKTKNTRILEGNCVDEILIGDRNHLWNGNDEQINCAAIELFWINIYYGFKFS